MQFAVATPLQQFGDARRHRAAAVGQHLVEQVAAVAMDGDQRAEAERHVGDERPRQQQPRREGHRRARVRAAGAREQVGGEAEEEEGGDERLLVDRHRGERWRVVASCAAYKALLNLIPARLRRKKRIEIVRTV